MNRHCGILLIVACLVLPLYADPIPAYTDSLFSPHDFPSLGRVTVTAGQTITFYTGTASNAPYVDGAGFSMEPGSVGESGSGKVRLAVFSFSELVLDGGSTVVVTGDLGLVLCSLNSIEVGTEISLAGLKGPAHNKGGAGGPGAEAGVSMVSTNSAPPTERRGYGGDGRGASQPATHGQGFGGGRVGYARCGGGGGSYGGPGGWGHADNGGTSDVSTVYGEPAMTNLLGGSGGAGGTHVALEDWHGGGGGGGGGALSLVAVRTITLDAPLSVAGADGVDHGIYAGQIRTAGAGGSGGGIILACRKVLINSPIDLRGGNGGTAMWTAESGGGGGGGRIAIYSDDDWGFAIEPPYTNAPPNVLLAGGAPGVSTAGPGATGTFYAGPRPRFIQRGLVITVK